MTAGGPFFVSLPFSLYLCTSRRRLVTLESRYYAGMNWLAAGSDAETWIFKDRGVLICVVNVDPRSHVEPLGLVTVLAHEAQHIWQACIEQMNEREAGSEFEAYTVQAVVDRLLRLYENQQRVKLAWMKEK